MGFPMSAEISTAHLIHVVAIFFHFLRNHLKYINDYYRSTSFNSRDIRLQLSHLTKTLTLTVTVKIKENLLYT